MKLNYGSFLSQLSVQSICLKSENKSSKLIIYIPRVFQNYGLHNLENWEMNTYDNKNMNIYECEKRMVTGKFNRSQVIKLYTDRIISYYWATGKLVASQEMLAHTRNMLLSHVSCEFLWHTNQNWTHQD